MINAKETEKKCPNTALTNAYLVSILNSLHVLSVCCFLLVDLV